MLLVIYSIAICVTQAGWKREHQVGCIAADGPFGSLLQAAEVFPPTVNVSNADAVKYGESVSGLAQLALKKYTGLTNSEVGTPLVIRLVTQRVVAHKPRRQEIEMELFSMSCFFCFSHVFSCFPSQSG